jgi:stress responsive alpha/beta barrel protein
MQRKTSKSVHRTSQVAETTPRPALFHVVLYRLAPTATAKQLKRIEKRFRDLPKQVDGVVEVWAGRNNSKSRFAEGWTFGVVMTLTGRDARDRFLEHEAHLAISRDSANGFYDEVAVFDLDM